MEALFGSNVLELEGVRYTLADLVLDWLQLLYTKPTQQLPILHMCNDVRGSGKTTFLQWVTYLFAPNATVVDRNDLESDFNGRWATSFCWRWTRHCYRAAQWTRLRAW